MKISAYVLLLQEMLAVLAAITEVIKSQNGAETETEYFAALMTTLEVIFALQGSTEVIG